MLSVTTPDGESIIARETMTFFGPSETSTTLGVTLIEVTVGGVMSSIDVTFKTVGKPAVPAKIVPNDLVPIVIGQPFPGSKGTRMRPELATAAKDYLAQAPMTASQKLHDQGLTILAEQMTFGGRRSGATLLKMAQSGQRARG